MAGDLIEADKQLGVFYQNSNPISEFRITHTFVFIEKSMF